VDRLRIISHRRWFHYGLRQNQSHHRIVVDRVADSSGNVVAMGGLSTLAERTAA
jgi:hypothetical protein